MNSETKYVERGYAVPEQAARAMVKFAERQCVKPWVLVDKVEDEVDEDDIRLNVLRPLVLSGVLTPNADGTIRVYNKDKLEEVIV